jgi:tetratricopeptide (TPR) repeat protein
MEKEKRLPIPPTIRKNELPKAYQGGQDMHAEAPHTIWATCWHSLKRITLKQAGVGLLAVPLALFLYRELRRDVVVIGPFSLPPSFVEAGFTPEVFANRVGDRLRRFATHERMAMVDLSVGSDPETIPEVEIPGTTLTLKTLMEVVRTLLGLSAQRIDGDITASVYLIKDTAHPTSNSYMIAVSHTRAQTRHTVSALVTDGSIDSLVNRAAELVLQEINRRLYAVHALRAHQYEEAMNFVYQTLQDPASTQLDQVFALNVWGNVLAAQRQFDDAATKYEEAVVLAPRSAAAYTNLGIVRRAQHRVHEAAGLYMYAIQLDPNDAMAYNDWGVLLKAQSQNRDAIAKYKEAIRLDPNNAMAYFNWANILLAHNDINQAIAGYQKAIALDPEYALAYDHLGNAKEALGNHLEAIAEFTKAIEIEPQSPAAYSDLGLVLEAMRQHEEAIAKYQKAIAVDEQYANAYTNWGDLLKAQGRDEEANTKYKLAQELLAHQ